MNNKLGRWIQMQFDIEFPAAKIIFLNSRSFSIEIIELWSLTILDTKTEVEGDFL